MLNNPYRSPEAAEHGTTPARIDLPWLATRVFGVACVLTWLAGIAVTDFDPVIGGVMVLWGKRFAEMFLVCGVAGTVIGRIERAWRS